MFTNSTDEVLLLHLFRCAWKTCVAAGCPACWNCSHTRSRKMASLECGSSRGVGNSVDHWKLLNKSDRQVLKQLLQKVAATTPSFRGYQNQLLPNKWPFSRGCQDQYQSHRTDAANATTVRPLGAPEIYTWSWAADTNVSKLMRSGR